MEVDDKVHAGGSRPNKGGQGANVADTLKSRRTDGVSANTSTQRRRAHLSSDGPEVVKDDLAHCGPRVKGGQYHTTLSRRTVGKAERSDTKRSGDVDGVVGRTTQTPPTSKEWVGCTAASDGCIQQAYTTKQQQRWSVPAGFEGRFQPPLRAMIGETVRTPPLMEGPTSVKSAEYVAETCGVTVESQPKCGIVLCEEEPPPHAVEGMTALKSERGKHRTERTMEPRDARWDHDGSHALKNRRGSPTTLGVRYLKGCWWCAENHRANNHEWIHCHFRHEFYGQRYAQNATAKSRRPLDGWQPYGWRYRDHGRQQLDDGARSTSKKLPRYNPLSDGASKQTTGLSARADRPLRTRWIQRAEGGSATDKNSLP